MGEKREKRLQASLPASGGLRCFLTYGRLLPVSLHCLPFVCVFMSKFPLFIRTSALLD